MSPPNSMGYGPVVFTGSRTCGGGEWAGWLVLGKQFFNLLQLIIENTGLFKSFFLGGERSRTRGLIVSRFFKICKNILFVI
jgi:hypothetical protein